MCVCNNKEKEGMNLRSGGNDVKTALIYKILKEMGNQSCSKPYTLHLSVGEIVWDILKGVFKGSNFHSPGRLLILIFMSFSIISVFLVSKVTSESSKSLSGAQHLLFHLRGG